VALLAPCVGGGGSPRHHREEEEEDLKKEEQPHFRSVFVLATTEPLCHTLIFSVVSCVANATAFIHRLIHASGVLSPPVHDAFCVRK